jgi:hypothetical protein
MKLFAVTILASTSTASAGPATWASYVDTSVKPRLIGQRPAPGNTGGGKTKGGMRHDEIDLDEDRPQQRSLATDLASFDDVMQQIARSPDAARPIRVSATPPVERTRVPGLTDKQLAELQPIDPMADKIDLRLTPKPEPVVIKPRRLANARPACGNTGGKTDMADEDCSVRDIKLAAELAAWEEQQAEKSAQRWYANHDKLLAAAEAIIRAEPALKARVLVDGRPACGNTQVKSSPPAFCRIDEDAR